MPHASRGHFDTTRWSLVRAAGGSHPGAAREALATLCETYWYPLYGYVRRQGNDAEDARDLVQSFILSILERDDLRGLRPEHGRFRAFLLASLRHFLSNQRAHDRALKRGGGQPTLPLLTDSGEERYLHEPGGTGTPETIFDRTWAVAVLDGVFQRIRAEWQAKGKSSDFDVLKGCLMGELPLEGYRSVAATLSTTEAAAKMAVTRLRRRFEQELRNTIADTVTDGAVDAELRYLLDALRR